jgi:hemoglobin
MAATSWWAMAALGLAVGCAGAKPAAKPPSEPAAKAEPAAPAKEEADGSAPAAETPASGTLFDRLGGMPAIEAVIADFMGNVAADERVNAPFAVSDLKLVQKRLVEFVCVATGGPCRYGGRDMKAAHRGMGVTNAQFDALVGDLVKTLEKLKVPEREKSELLGALGPLREQIVEAE